MNPDNFYHIATLEGWAAFQNEPNYATESLDTEGFIHCSYPAQLDETLELYFKNQGINRVVLLSIDPSVLEVRLVVETSRAGALFPHIYGAINKSAIVKVEERDL